MEREASKKLKGKGNTKGRIVMQSYLRVSITTVHHSNAVVEYTIFHETNERHLKDNFSLHTKRKIFIRTLKKP
jgi:hypothetical protein